MRNAVWRLLGPALVAGFLLSAGATLIPRDDILARAQTYPGVAPCLNLTSPAFGALGNNSTDTATPLNNALASLTGNGGCIFIPPGKYRFNAAVTLNLPAGIFSVSLYGGGQDTTILTWPNASGGLTFNYAGPNSSVHIRDLGFTTGTTAGGVALGLLQSSSNATPAYSAVSDVYRVTIRGDDGYSAIDYWSTGIAVSNVSNVQFENVAIAGASTPNGNGITLVGLPGSSTFGVQYNIAKSTFDNLGAGIVYGSFIQGVTVDQSNFTSNNGTSGGIQIPGAQTGALAQLAVTNSQFNVPGTAIALLTTSPPTTEVMLANNLFIQRANSSAINLGTSTTFSVTGNTITASSTTGTNAIASNGGIGTISGNVVTGFATGITLQASATAIVVGGNTLSTNTTAISNLAASVSNMIVNNPGYNPVGPAAITVTASPFTYTAGASPETVYIFSGTVSAVTIDKNGGGLGTVACGASPCAVDLGPFEQTKVTYTVAPSMNKMIH
jgi:hypothetical protein